MILPEIKSHTRYVRGSFLETLLIVSWNALPFHHITVSIHLDMLWEISYRRHSLIPTYAGIGISILRGS